MAGEKPSSAERKSRLAEALKANIAKRKAQAKTRKTAPDALEPPETEDGCPN